MTRQTAAALATILLQLRGRAVRCEGLIALSKDSCIACSGYPQQIEPIKFEIDSILRTVEALLDCFDREVNRCGTVKA